MAGPEKGDPGSGMIVYPRVPVPQQAPQRPSQPSWGQPGRPRGKGGGELRWGVIVALVIALAIGGAAGYLLKPSGRGELARAKGELAKVQEAARIEKDRADGLDQRLTVLGKDKAALEAKLAEVTAKAAEAEQAAAAAKAAAAERLQAAVDKSQGTVSTDGDEIRLQLVDKVLFAVGDDQLTPKGKAVLDKVGKALAELSDKQIWVQGHTDDQPIGAAAGKKKKGKDEPASRFASNWELSAARALQVVHYLQDTVKLDPSRLAAVAFGEYRPVSRTNKALNRRIEIVLYPKRAILEKESVAPAPSPPAKKK